MSNAVDPVLRKPRAILKAVLVRLLVYGGTGLAVTLWFVDLGVLRSRQPDSLPVADEPASNDRGWPHLRGPQYTAHSAETDLADSWPAEGPPVLWTREIGRGYSGLIAVGSRLYTQTQTLTEQIVVALDADTGRTVWEHRYGWPYDPGGMYPGPRATPTWSNGRIYFAAPDGLVRCLRAADGQQVWSVNINEKFDGRGTEFGYSCSPLIEDGMMIMPVGGPAASVVALNAENGETVWASGDAPASYCSAVPIRLGGRRQVVAFLQNELAGFDLQSGRQLWQEAYSRGYDEHSAFPLYAEPWLRTMQPFRGGSSLYELVDSDAAKDPSSITSTAVPAEFAASLDAERFTGSPGHNKATGREAKEPGERIKLVRHDAKMSNDVASSVLVDGYVYGFDIRDIQTNRHRPSRGQFRCMDFKTGEILWSSDRPGHATIVVADGKLLLFNDRGEVLLVRANPQRYEELAQAEVFRGEICWTAPSLHHSRLYVRSPTRAACLYVGNPERMDLRQRSTAAPTSAIPKAESLDVSWMVGAEREYPFELPDVRELTRWYAFSLAVFGLAAVAAVVVYGLGGCGRLPRCCGWGLFLRGGLNRKDAASTVCFLKRQDAASTVCFLKRQDAASTARLAAKLTLWIGLLLLGVIVTPLGNRLSNQFVFTWPVSLFASHQIALAAVLWVRQPDRGTKAAWVGAMGPAFLLFACLAYYDVTRRLSLAPAWYFLLTFLAAWPLAIPAARRILDRRSLVGDVMWTLCAFSVYFWASGALMLWRATIRG